MQGGGRVEATLVPALPLAPHYFQCPGKLSPGLARTVLGLAECFMTKVASAAQPLARAPGGAVLGCWALHPPCCCFHNAVPWGCVTPRFVALKEKSSVLCPCPSSHAWATFAQQLFCTSAAGVLMSSKPVLSFTVPLSSCMSSSLCPFAVFLPPTCCPISGWAGPMPAALWSVWKEGLQGAGGKAWMIPADVWLWVAERTN